MSATTSRHYLQQSTTRRFTPAEYHELIAIGVLKEGEPIELLEGYLIQKLPRGARHDTALDCLEGLLLGLPLAGWFGRPMRAVTLTDSEPEPDYAIVRGPRGRYGATHPTPAEIGLLVEVSDSSLLIDRHDKGRIYSLTGIPVYWVVNVVDKVIEVYTQPGGPTYGQRQDFPVGTDVPVVLDGSTVGTISAADVMG